MKNSLTILLRILFSTALFFGMGANPKEEDGHKKVNALIRKAEKAETKGKIEKALRHIENAYDLEPRHPIVQEKILRLNLLNGNHARAATLASYFGGEHNDTLRGPQLHQNIGMILLFTGEMSLFHKAKEHLELASMLNKRRCMLDFLLESETQEALGLCHALEVSVAGLPKTRHLEADTHQLKRAMNHFRLAVRYNPENTVALQNLEKIAQAIGQPVGETLPFEAPKICRLGVLPTIPKPMQEDSMFFRGKQIPLRDLPVSSKALLDSMAIYDELVLVLDISGSMTSPLFPGSPQTRFDAMIENAIFLVKNLNRSVKIGIITIGGDCGQKPQVEIKTTLDRDELLSNVQGLKPNGMTPLIAIFQTIPALFGSGYKPSKNRKGILLFSDGMNSCSPNGSVCMLSQEHYKIGIQSNVVSLLLESDAKNSGSYDAYSCMTQMSGGILVALKDDGSTETKEKPKFQPNIGVLLPEITVDTCAPNAPILYRMDLNAVTQLFKSKIEMFNPESNKDATHKLMTLSK